MAVRFKHEQYGEIRERLSCILGSFSRPKAAGVDALDEASRYLRTHNGFNHVTRSIIGRWQNDGQPVEEIERAFG